MKRKQNRNEWSGISSRSLTPSTVDYDNLTHVCFSFVEPDGNGWVKPLNSDELGNLWDLVQLAHAKDVKVLLAVGGWISDDRSVRERAWKFADDQNISQIKNFVGQITQVVDGFGLDGVDLDWEFPKSKSAWNLVVAEFKKEIKDERGKLLTAAVAASEFKWHPNDADYTGAAQVGVTADLDFISIMGYDWWGHRRVLREGHGYHQGMERRVVLERDTSGSTRQTQYGDHA